MIVRTDPFEDVESVRFRMDDEATFGWAPTGDRPRSVGLRGHHRGVTDAEIEALLERIEAVPVLPSTRWSTGTGLPVEGAWVNSRGANTVYTTEGPTRFVPRCPCPARTAAAPCRPCWTRP